MSHPIVNFFSNPKILDLTQTKGVQPLSFTEEFAIGRYNEKREGIYQHALFVSSEKKRNIHMGLDIFAAVGTEIFCFSDGEIFDFKDRSNPGDYGPTLITKHNHQGRELYCLLGHLSLSSLVGKKQNAKVFAGEVLGTIGSTNENGNWPPHVHVQFSWQAPKNCDLPGVVASEDLSEALLLYPDPQTIATLY